MFHLFSSIGIFFDVDKLCWLLEAPTSSPESHTEEDENEKKEGATGHNDGDDGNSKTFNLFRRWTSLDCQQSLQAHCHLPPQAIRLYRLAHQPLKDFLIINTFLLLETGRIGNRIMVTTHYMVAIKIFKK